MKQNRKPFKPRSLTIPQYKARVNKQRSDSVMWKVMSSTYDFDKADFYYCRLYSFLNLAYILCDVQDWCLRDAQDIMAKFRTIKIRQQDKQNFNNIRQAVTKALFYMKEQSHTVASNKDSQRYVMGNSDLYYFVLRMLMDRMGKKREALHLIHLLRHDFENHNQIFPELDKGRYTFDF